MDEKDLLLLRAQIEQDIIKKIEKTAPFYKQKADEAFRVKFREKLLPKTGYTTQLSNLEQKIRYLYHEIRKLKHPEHRMHSAPPIVTEQDYYEAAEISSDLIDFIADHFELTPKDHPIHPIQYRSPADLNAPNQK